MKNGKGLKEKSNFNEQWLDCYFYYYCFLNPDNKVDMAAAFSVFVVNLRLKRAIYKTLEVKVTINQAVLLLFKKESVPFVQRN